MPSETEIIEIILLWQNGGLDGYAARRLCGVRSFGDLYKLALRHGIDVSFRPRDLLAAVRADKMTEAAAAAALGMDVDEWQSLAAALES
jgi:hypothetical protein